jgi:hypothetical protein
MDARETDTAKRPQHQSHYEALCEDCECETRSRPEQSAPDIKPATIHAIRCARQERDGYGVSGEVDAADPAGFARVESQIGSDLGQGRRKVIRVARFATRPNDNRTVVVDPPRTPAGLSNARASVICAPVQSLATSDRNTHGGGEWFVHNRTIDAQKSIYDRVPHERAGPARSTKATARCRWSSTSAPMNASAMPC